VAKKQLNKRLQSKDKLKNDEQDKRKSDGGSSSSSSGDSVNEEVGVIKKKDMAKVV
jgi:hypothetical protein